MEADNDDVFFIELIEDEVEILKPLRNIQGQKKLRVTFWYGCVSLRSKPQMQLEHRKSSSTQKCRPF